MSELPEMNVHDVVATRSALTIEQDGLKFLFVANNTEQATSVNFDPSDFPLLEAQIDQRVETASNALAHERYQVKADMITARVLAAIAIGLGGVGAAAAMTHEDKVSIQAFELFGLGLAAGAVLETTVRSGNKPGKQRINKLETEISALQSVKEYVVPTSHNATS